MSGYSAKVYMEQGAAKLVVDNGGSIQVMTGGKILPNSGTQAAHIADPSGGATTDAEARTAIDAILVVLESVGLTASS